MPISFAQIPANLKIPLYWVEVDPSKAGLPTLRQPALLVGVMNGLGEATPDVPIAVGTQAQADKHFGQGSELARMFKAFFANNFANEVWGVGVMEDVTWIASTGTIVVAQQQSEAGTIHLYIGGQHIAATIGTSWTKAQVAQELADQINEVDDMPVIATVGTGTPPISETVTLTAKWKGISGDDISVSLNYYGTIGGEELPPGLGLQLPVTGFLTGGEGVPVFDNVIAAMGEQQFEYVAMPYTDAQSLIAWETEYGFSDTGRWGWMRELFGHVFSAKRDTYSNLMVFGPTRNSGVVSIMAVEVESPTPVYEWTAAYTAKAQRALTNDPARPLQTLSLNSVLSAPLEDRFNVIELNSIAGVGLATQKTPVGTVPMISRESTTYQFNLYGQGDDAYELVTTLATLARLIRNQRHAITTKYPRHKLANDGTRFGPGQAIVTPGIVKAELIAQYRQDEFNGLVEDTRNFKRHLMVERDPNNPNRLNVLYPPDLINQLRIFAVLAQFRLQYDRGIDVEIIGTSGVTGVTARPLQFAGING